MIIIEKCVLVFFIYSRGYQFVVLVHSYCNAFSEQKQKYK